jgi:hypothetical protein
MCRGVHVHKTQTGVALQYITHSLPVSGMTCFLYSTILIEAGAEKLVPQQLILDACISTFSTRVTAFGRWKEELRLLI